MLLNRTKQCGEDKFQRLKSIILKIIDENKFVRAAIQRHAEDSMITSNMVINICCGDWSYSKPDDNSIGIGMDNVYRSSYLLMYLKCNACMQFFKSLSTPFDIYYDSHKAKDIQKIIVQTGLGEESDVILQLHYSNYLSSFNSSSDLILTKSLSFLLFHEIGHLIHDPYILESCPMTRERIADAFAFEALMSGHNNPNNVNYLGALLAVGQMLLSRSQDEEIEDIEHPHSIERMYELFRFWNVPDNSPYWEIAFCIIKDWGEKYHQDLTWIKESSLSFKDKVNDAYEHFRKK